MKTEKTNIVKREIVSLDEAKAQIRVLHNHEDEHIKRLIDAAINYCQDYTCLDVFDADATTVSWEQQIFLPRNISNIVVDGKTTDDYKIIKGDFDTKIILNEEPTAEIKVTYKIIGQTEGLEGFMHAVLLMIGDFYNKRENTLSNERKMANSLLNNYKKEP